MFINTNKLDYQKIWLLTWPVMLSNISQPLLGLADIVVIGHLPDSKYLAAVAIGTTLFTFIYWAFGFLRMGTTGMIAQLVGAKDGSSNRTVLAQSLILGLAIALFLILFQQAIIHYGIALLAPPKEVLEYAISYSNYRIFGAPAVLCTYVLVGWFVGNQTTKVLLILLISTNLLNIVLDVIAVNVLGLKVNGLAMATVISEYFGLLLALWFCRKMLLKIPGVIAIEKLKRLSYYLPILKVNRYIFVRTILLLIAMSFFTAQGAKLGTDILAANVVLMSFVTLIAHALDGYAHSIEALAGKAVGEKDLSKFHQFVSAAAVFSIFTALLFSLFFLLAGEWIITVLTSIKTVQLLANEYLPWLVILPLLAVSSFLIDGIFVGTTQARLMQNTMIISVVFVYFPIWWLSSDYDNHGLWFSLMCMYLARGITGAWAYYHLSKNKLWINPLRA